MTSSDAMTATNEALVACAAELVPRLSGEAQASPKFRHLPRGGEASYDPAEQWAQEFPLARGND